MIAEENFVVANGLSHHVMEWKGGERAVVLLHGFLDSAASFEPLAQHLAERGLRVIAFDFRGHGETEWAAASGYYYFTDYLLDLDELLTALGLDSVDLVGHSMGGTVATMYAGTRPGRVRSVVTVEGIGPLEGSLEDMPDRISRWLDGVARAKGRTGRPIADLDEALDRMRTMHPTLPDGLGRALVARATRPHASGTGLAWRFDPRHRTQSPIAFRRDTYLAVLRRIAAPALVVMGERGLRLPDEAERVAAIPGARCVEIPAVGHMIHWHATERLAELVHEHVVASDAAKPQIGTP